MNNDRNIKDLKDKFIEIQKLNWIKGSSNGRGNVGITFENILGKERENFPIADYNGIEIKTSTNYHRNRYITLFSAAPDGPYIYQNQILRDKFGWLNKNNEKIFYSRITANKYTKITNKYYMKVEISYLEKRIYLKTLNTITKTSSIECFWNFDTIEEKIQKKIQYLALIIAEKKEIANQAYFKYKKINFYKSKDLATFLKLLGNGNIAICFKIGIYKTGKKKGQTYDHGTGFELLKDKLSNLYDELK